MQGSRMSHKQRQSVVYKGTVTGLRISGVDGGATESGGAFIDNLPSEALAGSYTMSLLHFDGADESVVFTDQGGKVWTPSGGAKIDDAQSKFGGTSAYFDGNLDYIGTPTNSDYDFTTGDFTIDLWIMPSAKANYRRIIGYGASTPGWNAVTGWHWILTITNNNYLNFQYSLGTGESNDCGNSSVTISDDVWTHIAVVRSGTTIYYFIDGVNRLTATSQPAMVLPSGTKVMRVATFPGEEAANTYQYPGWIDELRISKGIARWTSDFTPPTTAYGHHADGAHQIEIYPSAGGALGLSGVLKAEGLGAEGLGAEIATGTCVISTLYKITATEADHYGTGLIVGSYFTSAGTETNDANNKVKQVLAPSTSGATIVSAKGGVTYNFAYKNVSFTYNASSYYCVLKLLR